MKVANTPLNPFDYQLPAFISQDQNSMPTAEDILDTSIFEQLVAMDDDSNPYFSYSIVLEYFEQAQKAFQDMNNAFSRYDLSELSRIGHFLKGSSAAIGLKQIKICCEEIQNLNKLPDHTEAFQKAKKLLLELKQKYDQAEQLLKDFFEAE